MKVFESIEGAEFDWFASDQDGSFAIFATSGTGLVPEVVMQASKAHSLVADSIEVTGWGSEKVWDSYSSQGLYIYDCEHPSGPCIKIRSPASDLEPDLRLRLESLVLSPVFCISFAHANTLNEYCSCDAQPGIEADLA